MVSQAMGQEKEVEAVGLSEMQEEPLEKENMLLRKATFIKR